MNEQVPTRLAEIRARLLAGATPVAMIESASLPQQRECLGTLAGMAEDAAGFGLRSPAVLVIGEVVTKQRLSTTTLKFLLAARQSQLQGLEALASTSVLVGHVSRLVHALQKERGYSTLFLSSSQAQMPGALARLRDEAEAVETEARRFLLDLEPAELRSADKTRLLHCISYALYRLDGLPDLRWQVRERKLQAQEAGIRFTRIIACLLSLVFEAADSALDPDITRILVALFNFMQGKESSGQERAVGAMGYRAGYCAQTTKEHLLSLIASQRRSFDIFAQYADGQTLRMWQDIRPAVEPMHRLRDILLKTSPADQLDPVWPSFGTRSAPPASMPCAVSNSI